MSITRADGKILANKFTRLDDRQIPRYEPAPDDRSMPYDADRERTLRSGETFQRLDNGAPVQFHRVWTDQTNVADDEPVRSGRPRTERGRGAPQVVVRLSPNEHAQLEQDAIERDVSPAEVLRRAYFGGLRPTSKGGV